MIQALGTDIGGKESLADSMAAWAHGLRFAAAPAEVQQALRNCLLYNLSMALAVDHRTDGLGQALASIADSAGPARLFAGRGRRSPGDAAFINASLVTARGQNDTHPEVVTHIGCVVIPAVLALADLADASQQQLLDALLVGYESIPKVASALASTSTRRGFRASSTYGALGAALAGSVLLRLSPAQTRSALSIATQTASGLLQTWADGSDEWRFQIAKASRDGVHAALLAQAGVRGAEHCLEGANGFGQAYAAAVPVLDFAAWHTPQISFKPYPGCAFNQAPVQALRELLLRDGIDPRRIRHIMVRMHPADAAYPGVAACGPFESPAAAIMSAPFMLAATLQDGQPAMAHFETQFQSPSLQALAGRVQVHADASLAPWKCAIALETDAGAVHRHDFAHAQPFVLDWERTRVLACQVSAEWPAPGAASFAALESGVRMIGLGHDHALSHLQQAIYQ